MIYRIYSFKAEPDDGGDVTPLPFNEHVDVADV